MSQTGYDLHGRFLSLHLGSGAKTGEVRRPWQEALAMMGPAGWIWMLVWIAALLFMVWLIVRRPEGDTPAEDALSILRARFARGEISETEFERACTVLRTDRLETTR